MKSHVLFGLGVILILGILVIPLSDASNIPPTRAWTRIFAGDGNVTATSYAGNLTLTGSGIDITSYYNNNTIRFESQSSFPALEQLTNVTSAGCAVGQIRVVSVGGIWTCSDTSGGGEVNDAANVGTGEGEIFRDKTGVTLNMRTLKANGNVTITTSGDEILISAVGGSSSSGITKVNNVGSGTIKLVQTNSSGTVNIKSLVEGQGITLTNGTTGGTIATSFKLDDLSATNKIWPVGFTNSSGDWTTRTFALNNQTLNKDYQIVAINNQTGVITRNQFSVNNVSTTCSGTDKVSSITLDNSTGYVVVTCSTDQSGSATARENLVADWNIDTTWTNIGTAYVDVYTIANSNGEAIRIDTNGMSTVTLQIIWTKVGAGTQSCNINSLTTGGTLIRINNLATGINTNATQTIPTALQNQILNFKPQCKSTTGTDDPVWLHGQVLLR